MLTSATRHVLAIDDNHGVVARFDVGLPCVKKRPLLTTHPSITRNIPVTSSWYGTRFAARTKVSGSKHASCSQIGVEIGDKGPWLV
jgi:hypothetical protein